MKIAVVHDHLGWSGGGERTALLTALELDADFITAYAGDETYPHYQKSLGQNLKILTTKVVHREVIRYFWLRYVFWKNRAMFSGYDVLIASGQAATEVVAKYGNRRSSKILYCHTPPRRIYDLYDSSRQRYKWFLRPLFSLFARYWHFVYIKALLKLDYIIANSKNIADRLYKYTGYSANEIIWPPILTDHFEWRSQGDYFLSWARVDEHKRVDLVVKAFTMMPDKKLIVASGGSRLNEVKEMAQGHENIKIVGWQTDEDLKMLVGNCMAAIYIPVNEDAGMTHLEANAAGKPVIGVKEGGLIESIESGKTGVFIKSDPEESDIIDAVNILDSDKCLKMKDACIAHARNYDYKIFVEKIKNAILRNDPALPVIGLDGSRSEDPRFSGKKQRTGVEVYSNNLINSMVDLIDASSFRIKIYAPKPNFELSLKLQSVIPGKKAWTIWHLSRHFKYNPPDYFFTPAYFIPRYAPQLSYATVHDVIFKSSPDKYSFFERAWQNMAVKNNLRRADKIITVSEVSKKEILEYYKVHSEKIIVIPIGYDRWIYGNSQNERKKEFVYIGRVEKKKSVSLLVEAFDEFNKQVKGWRLQIAGKDGFGAEEIKMAAKRLAAGDLINFVGYISDQEKAKMLKSASVFVHPSSNEGYCIPLYEAWDAETPAILSDAELLKEVGRDGAMYFLKNDKHDLSEKMKLIATDRIIGERVVENGLTVLNSVSWRDTAASVLKVITGNSARTDKR